MIYYLGWNLWWLSQVQTPPSILQYHTGIPVPTTGMTRSVKAMLNGDLLQSVHWNAFTMPILILFVWSIGYSAYRWCQDNTINLPEYLVWGWSVVLPIAWLVKLCQGPAWW